VSSTNCRGLVTVDQSSSALTHHAKYCLLVHIGRYVIPAAARIGSTYSNPAGVYSIAFRGPDGTHVALLYNAGSSSQPVTILCNGMAAQVRLPPASMATARW